MKNLSLKLEEHIYSETENLISKLNKSRNRYINEALEYYNKVQKRKLLSEQLEKESRMVASDSMDILWDFEQIENED